MTTVKFTKDNRVLKPKIDGGTYLWGLYETRDTVGGDRTQAEKEAGVWPPHTYKGSRSFSLFGDYHLKWTSFGVVHEGREGMAGGTGCAVNQDHVWNANDELVLLGRLAEKYRQHDWNVGVFIGELGKTVDTVASRFKQLARAAAAVKRGNITLAFKLLSVPPDPKYLKKYGKYGWGRTSSWYEVWLELRYAWRPLLMDIYELSGAIQKLDVPRQVQMRASFKIPKTFASTMPAVFAVKGEGAYQKFIIATVSEKPFSLPEYLGLTNPGAIFWELLPGSFILDWVIPIGNYIQTRSTLAGMQGSYVRTTYDWHRCRVVGMAPGYSPDVTPPSTSEYSDPSGASSSVFIDRTYTTTLSVPLPTFRQEFLGSSPAARVTDALALLQAVFLSPSKRPARYI